MMQKTQAPMVAAIGLLWNMIHTQSDRTVNLNASGINRRCYYRMVVTHSIPFRQ